MSEDKGFFERLKKRFREETSKLDRWIYHGKIENYVAESEEAAKLKKELLERHKKVIEELEEIEEEKP